MPYIVANRTILKGVRHDPQPSRVALRAVPPHVPCCMRCLTPRPPGLGPGRPPQIVRERARRYFAEHIETLNNIACGTELDGSGSTPTTSERIRAIVALGKFGIGTNFGPEPRDRPVLEVRVVDESKEMPRLE